MRSDYIWIEFVALHHHELKISGQAPLELSHCKGLYRNKWLGADTSDKNQMNRKRQSGMSVKDGVVKKIVEFFVFYFINELIFKIKKR